MKIATYKKRLNLNEKEKQEVKENLPQEDVNESVAGKGKSVIGLKLSVLL